MSYGFAPGIAMKASTVSLFPWASLTICIRLLHISSKIVGSLGLGLYYSVMPVQHLAQ